MRDEEDGREVGQLQDALHEIHVVAIVLPRGRLIHGQYARAHGQNGRDADPFLLAKAQGGSFQKVLDSTAKYDSNELVRRMAIALGGTNSEQQEKTPLEPTAPQEIPPETVNPPNSSGSTQQPPGIYDRIKL